MSRPWFRRYGLLGFKPISPEGRFVRAATIAVVVPGMVAAAYFNETHPTVSELIGIISVLAGLASFVLVVWKMDWEYGRK